MTKIVFAGGTGNLGNLLIPYFREREDEIVVLSRRKMVKHHPRIDFVLWDGETQGEWTEALQGADVIINLSGASINKRFTAKNKKLLYNSRLQPTKALATAIQSLDNPAKLWINFSGVAIFNGAEDLQDEHGNAYGDDFLAKLSIDWEAACTQAHTPQTEKVILRMSPVLSKQSGIIRELTPLAKLGLAGTLGSGKQMMPWIHEEDFCRLVCWIIDQEQQEPIYHACSPHPESNKNFMKTLRQVVGRSIGLPLPTPLAKVGALLKGTDPTLLLETVPVTTNVTLKNGFKFNFPYLHDAIKQLIK
ncbi:TIGR01777 family oxidoreductase [Sphingobacterium sp. UBA6645]|uniref:TIGR01777 family oxidoreductase n=1 Tax=Sphingobacterium sp. UBA6645 TaxID=1947511 RepID=UPI0025DA8D8C|nr:TIGR01777 family oxidoreductase [Sphingobacterium sp. UBA6645]